MKSTSRAQLPVAPLLRAYVEAGLPRAEQPYGLPGLGPRFQAIRAAPGLLLAEQFLDSASPADFQAALLHFYQACVQPALHAEVIRRRSEMVRHALGHLCRCADPLPRKAERCLD